MVIASVATAAGVIGVGGAVKPGYLHMSQFIEWVKPVNSM